MKQEEILKRSKKILTNKFTGNMGNVSNAIMDKFQFNIENKDNVTHKIAIIPAYLETTGYELLKEGDVITGVQKHNHNTEALRSAGYMVDCILDDATVCLGKLDETDKQIVMSAGNPTKKIADFLAYRMTNPILLKEMTIVTDDQNSFNGDMEVCELNPFSRTQEKLVELSKFFDKYQQQADRIDISFANNELQISDVLLWTMNLPPKAKLQITLMF